MGFVRRGGGGGGGDEGGGDEEQGVSIKRCEVCRRELLPWEDVCPDDGGRAVTPQQIQPDHDALLARLLAEEEDGGDGADQDGEAAVDATGGDGADQPDDGPVWPA